MIKWFAYIVMLLIFAPCLLSAKTNNDHFNFIPDKLGITLPLKEFLTDTTNKKNNKKQEQDEKKKIKELATARRQPKPEKIEPGDNKAKPKQRPPRQRRPEGLERPPEIPRRNGP